MRRYELMLVMRPELPDEQAQSIIERVTRSVTDGEGQLIKVNPWGRRRLAYPIGGNREGSYFLVLFDASATVVTEIERSLNITEEVLRHLVVRVERPAAARRTGAEDEADFEAPPEEEEEEPAGEFIDESESEAAPAATDR